MDQLEDSVRIDMENKLDESCKTLDELNNTLEEMKDEGNQKEITKIETKIYEQHKVSQNLVYMLLRNNVQKNKDKIAEVEQEITLTHIVLERINKILEKKLKKDEIAKVEQDKTNILAGLELMNKKLEIMKADEQKFKLSLAKLEQEIMYSDTMSLAARGDIDVKLNELNKALEKIKIEGDKLEITKIEGDIYELNKIAKEADETQEKRVENMLVNMDEETRLKSLVWFQSYIESLRVTEEANTKTNTESKE
jgi:hypothetical protein